MKRNSRKKSPASSPTAAAKSELISEVEENSSTLIAPALKSLTRFLTVRDHSHYELRTKLARNYPPEVIEKVMIEADRRGWLAPETEIAERLALALARRHKSHMYIVGLFKIPWF